MQDQVIEKAKKLKTLIKFSDELGDMDDKDINELLDDLMDVEGQEEALEMFEQQNQS